jgi:DNA modification methylase
LATDVKDWQYVIRENLNLQPSNEKHIAMFPEKLISPMILSGCPMGGVILDPFMGAGTTGLVAKKLNRNYLGIELNPEYVKIAENRIAGQTPPML